MKLAGATVGTAFLGGAAYTASASPDKVVDLGEEGLSEGDVIDPYLEEYFENGVEVRIPEGEYDWEGGGFHRAASRDAAVIGEGEVILQLQGGKFQNNLRAEGGSIALKNFTVRGKVTSTDGTRFRFETDEDGYILVDNVNFPDGVEEGRNARPFYLPREHEGLVEFRNCYFADFTDNGIYASSPGYPGEGGGTVVIENCVSRRTNISAFRIGPDESVVRNCLVLNDGAAPESESGHMNMRGLYIRAPGEDMLVENTEIIQSSDAGGTLVSFGEADGSTGEFKDVRIRNDSSSSIIRGPSSDYEGWEATNLSVTGDGDLDVPSHFDVLTGSDAEEPTGEDPRESTDDTSEDDSTSGDEDAGSEDEQSDADEEPTLANDEPVETELVLVTDNSTGVDYSFTATEEITPLYDRDNYSADDTDPGESAEENDDGTWTATGSTAGGSHSGDAFAYEGGVVDFSVSGDTESLMIYRNGEAVTREQLLALDQEKLEQLGEDDAGAGDDEDADDAGDEDLSNVLIIDGTPDNKVCTYRVEVSGQIERSDGLSSVANGGTRWDELDDQVDDSTATGIVAKGMDGYRYSGTVTRLDIDGRADVTIEQVE